MKFPFRALLAGAYIRTSLIHNHKASSSVIRVEIAIFVAGVNDPTLRWSFSWAVLAVKILNQFYIGLGPARMSRRTLHESEPSRSVYVSLCRSEDLQSKKDPRLFIISKFLSLFIRSSLIAWSQPVVEVIDVKSTRCYSLTCLHRAGVQKPVAASVSFRFKALPAHDFIARSALRNCISWFKADISLILLQGTYNCYYFFQLLWNMNCCKCEAS